ncbi:MAG: hypothetical protein AAB853_00560, partial [Patescibacteria group bacterium]
RAEEGYRALLANDKLFEICERNVSLEDALEKGNEILRMAVKGISDIITFPGIIAQFLQTAPRFERVVTFISTYLNANSPSPLYLGLYFLLVLLFTYFYVSVTFRPDQLAEDIQKRGGFIPGIRPGRQTAEVLQKVSVRLNLWGGVFLGIIAIIPLLFTRYSSLNSQDLLLSGSGLIIVVGVVLEIIRQVNAQLLAHDYEKLA